jgi:hypothetical protein
MLGSRLRLGEMPKRRRLYLRGGSEAVVVGYGLDAASFGDGDVARLVPQVDSYN